MLKKEVAVLQDICVASHTNGKLRTKRLSPSSSPSSVPSPLWFYVIPDSHFLWAPLQYKECAIPFSAFYWLTIMSFWIVMHRQYKEMWGKNTSIKTSTKEQKRGSINSWDTSVKKLGQPSNLMTLKRNCRGCPAAICNYSESTRNVTGRAVFLETGRFN